MAKIHGAKELRAAIRRAEPMLRDEATKEVRASTIRMHRKVKELLNSAASYAPLYHGGPGMQNITGVARRSYRYSVTDKGMTGRVGLLSSKAESSAFYLRFFFYGTSHQPSRNAHDDAFEDERDVFVVNQQAALNRVISRLL